MSIRSADHLNSAKEYQELESEFDRLGIPCVIQLIKCLGRYLPASFLNCANFIQNEIKVSRSTCRLNHHYLHLFVKNFRGKRLA